MAIIFSLLLYGNYPKPYRDKKTKAIANLFGYAFGLSNKINSKYISANFRKR